MTLRERCAAVDACRWTSQSIPDAPYVTSLPWISHYGCKYVVHGDDITSDADGNDCYRFVKEAGRFRVVRRTPGISTTDLVGRMLLCTKGHHIKSLDAVLEGQEGDGGEHERKGKAMDMQERIKEYASDESGLQPGPEVWIWRAYKGKQHPPLPRRRSTASSVRHGGSLQKLPEERGSVARLVEGKPPRPGQRVVGVDGGWDLFSTGHIEFLKAVIKTEEEQGKQNGWYEESARQKRISDVGEDYGPAYVVAGVHDDETVNFWKGINYPIMNIFERGLCVLQCAVSHRSESKIESRLTGSVRPRSHFQCAAIASSIFPQVSAIWNTCRHLSRPNEVHAYYL